jgi:uncharacterized metal-binding protein YceD (DUF177 family)
MKKITFPVSFFQSTAVIDFCWPSDRIENSLHNHPARKDPFMKAHSLKFSEIDTPWLQPFFEEHNISEVDRKSLQFRLNFKRNGNVVRVQSEFHFAPVLECVRCLCEFSEKLVFEPEAIFCKEEATLRVHEHELDREELLQYNLEDDKLNLDEFLLDSLVTSLPVHPVCSESCKGLCSECGVDLNHVGTCNSKASKESCIHFPYPSH